MKTKDGGMDGNIFNLVAIASEALKKDGKPEMAKELCNKLFDCSSYEDALRLIAKYCEIS